METAEDRWCNKVFLENFAIKNLLESSDSTTLKTDGIMDLFTQVMARSMDFAISQTNVLLKPNQYFEFMRYNFVEFAEACSEEFFNTWAEKAQKLWLQTIRQIRNKLLSHWINLIFRPQ